MGEAAHKESVFSERSEICAVPQLEGHLPWKHTPGIQSVEDNASDFKKEFQKTVFSW